MRSVMQNDTFNGAMPDGYKIYTPQLSSPSAGSRAGRSYDGISFWAVGAEGINSAAISGYII